MDLKILTTFVALMRNLLSVLYALLFGAALTVSCGQAGRSLNEVERTVNDYPDSALIALRAIRPHTPRLKAQHALLTSRALDKAYIDIEEDSIARIAVDWYRHRRPLSKRMMAWYYLGRVQMNGGNYSSAIISLMEAESLAERIHDNHYLGLIEQNISEIYNLSYDPKHALEASDRSIDAFTRAQEPEYINWSVLNKANILIGLRQYGDADSLLSLLLQKESQYGRFRQEVQKHLILLNLYQDNASPEQTLEMIRDLQRQGYSFYRPEDFSLVAYAYSLVNERDSCRDYLALAYQRIGSRVDEARVRYDHYRILNHLGDHQGAMENLEAAVFTQDSILFDHIKNSISFALKDYAEKTAEQKAEESKTLGIISVLLFLLIIILVFIMVNAMRLSKKALLDEMSRVQEYGETISELLGSKVTLLRTLSDEYYKLEEEPSWDKPARTKEEIIKSFRTQIGELRTDSSIMEGIEMALDAKYHGLMTSLKESFGPSLKAEDYKILALVLSEVPRPVIRFLTRISDDALRKRISRYREKFKGLPDEQRDLLLEILSPQKVS